MTNFMLTEELFPKYTPSSHFNFTMNFNDRQELFAVYKLQGSTFRNKL